MSKLSMKAKLARTAVGTAMVGATVASLFVGSASADPKQFSAAVGVGSDTTQDVLNAMAGFHNGVNYTPIQSDTASGKRQVVSFDATGTACISVKPGGASFNRPNGSSAGRRALSRAADGTGYGDAACGGVKDISGQVDFARSSAGPVAGDTGTALTYVPFGRDALSFAYYRASGPAVTDLTKAELVALFTNGATVIDGVRILPCGIQTSSGTFQFWNTALGIGATEAAATTECNNLLGARAQENDGDDLKARGDAAHAAVPGTQVVIGFSAANFIARSNGVGGNVPPAGVLMGSISNNGSGVDLGSPVQGAAPTLSARATFYNDTTFGRNVYNVVQTSKIDSAFGNADLKTLFKGSTSAVCQATNTIQTFGYLPVASCGSTTLKGSYFTGQL